MKKKICFGVISCFSIWAFPSQAYEVWMGTHLMESSVATNLQDWEMVASKLDGVNINRAPHDTNPASNPQWQTIIQQVNHVGTTIVEIARPEVSRNPNIIDDDLIPNLSQEINQKLQGARNYGYEIDHIMIYDERIDGTLFEWTQTEIQHLRDQLDAKGQQDIGLIWRSTNNAQRNRNFSALPIIDHALIEASADRFINNRFNVTTLLKWLWTNPATAHKDVILQIPRSENSMSQYAATRRVAVTLGEEIGYENGLQSDRLVFLPVTYNDNYNYLPETTSNGTSYTNSLTSTALSLIEQRPLFEGRTGIPTNADADSFVRDFMEPPPGDYSTLIAGWETWNEVASDTWNATQVSGVVAQATGSPEAGGVFFNFNNATVENGASSDGQYGSLGPAVANTSVAAPSDAVALSNGFDGFIDFTLTDTTGVAIELTGFHFDIGAFRSDAATDWELEILAGGDLTAGAVASGVATINAGPIQDDETINLTVLADSTLDANGSVTFRLNFTGGEGVSGSPKNGHHLFLDNVGVTGLTVGLPGDFNSDGNVDGADFLEWQRNGGTATSLSAWQSNYGAYAQATSSTAVVPEPSSVVLATILAASVVSINRQI